MIVQILFSYNHNCTNLFFDDSYDDEKEFKNLFVKGWKEEERWGRNNDRRVDLTNAWIDLTILFL